MQNTRLTVFVDLIFQQVAQQLRNPWRRVSCILVSLLFGNFAATVISTITGQTADWDVLVALVLLSSCELISWAVYRRRPSRPNVRASSLPSGQNLAPEPLPASPALLLTVANAVKLGLVYGLFVEAFKLGS